jgi:hypothetical protein
MSSKKLLVPAVMVSMAAAVASVDAAAAPQPAAATVVPAVMSERAPATYPVPASLADYTRQKSAETQMSLWADDPGHCATISGSDGGWDDSDCMR